MQLTWQDLLVASENWQPLLLDAAAKSVVVLLIAGIVAWLMARRGSAGARHMMWFASMVSLLFLPLFSSTLPGWKILPDVPELTFSSGGIVSIGPETSPPPTIVSDLYQPRQSTVHTQPPANETLSGVVNRREPAREAATAVHTSPAPTDRHQRESSVGFAALLFTMWILGVLAVLLRTAVSLLSLWRLGRTAQSVTDDTLPGMLRSLCDEFGIKQQVKLLARGQQSMPMVWGVFRPKILLPLEAESWPEVRKRVVLLHELAHIKRWDCLTHTIAQIVCAFYWPNPLVWIAKCHLQSEREKACDDLVLSKGSSPSDYADHLLQITLELRSHPLAAQSAVAMARTRSTENRLMAILDNRRNRRLLTRKSALIASVLMVAAIIPLAAAQLVAREEKADDPGTSRIELPEDRTWGKIYACSWDGAVPEKWDEEAEIIGDVRGDVEIPEDKELVLRVPEGTSPDLEAMGNLLGDRLGGLILKKTEISDEDLANLPRFKSLRVLDLEETSTTDKGLEHVGEMKDLEWLRLNRLNLTAEGLRHLANLKDLQCLDTNKADIGNDGLAQIAQAKSLRVLEIENTKIDDVGLAHLSQLKSLEKLILKDNEITDEGLSNLANLSSLQTLNLQRTLISDAGLVHLGSLDKLDELRLPMQITNEGLRHLENLPNLEQSSPRKRLSIRVVAKDTAEPIRGAKVRVIHSAEESGRSDDRIPVDEDGNLVIGIPEEPLSYMSFKAEAEGRVATSASWRDVDNLAEIPEEYTLELEKGTSIGGIVRNEKSEPIEGSVVTILGTGERVANGVQRPSLGESEVTTNASGEWRCDVVPSEMKEVWIKFSHVDYISDGMYGETPAPPMSELRGLKGVTVMKKGIDLKGVVLDTQDQPIQGAQILQGTDRFGTDFPSTKTNDGGEFEFKSCRPGEVVLTVQAEGYAPDVRRITLEEGVERQRFVLEPGYTLRIQVTDKTGTPVSGVRVTPDTWRGYRTIRGIGYESKETDANGRFEWRSAPEDEVKYDFLKKGMIATREVGLSASEGEQTVVMASPLIVRGNVTDSESGDPIAKFDVVPILAWKSASTPFIERSGAAEASEGYYEIKLARNDVDHIVRIESSGYLPAVTGKYSIDDGTVTQDFELQRAENITGRVRSMGGSPIEGAEVALATISQHLSLRDGRLSRKDDALWTTTDGEGGFSFFPQDEDYKVVCVHDLGYAEVTKEEFLRSREVTLQPWGKVKGELHQIKPVPNVRMYLNQVGMGGSGDYRLFNRFSTTTDQSGRFSFDRVPPGPVNLSADLGVWQDSDLTSSEHVPLEVRSGKTHEITIGKRGCVVAGALTSPDLPEDFDWNYGLNYLVRMEPGLTVPSEIEHLGFDVSNGWNEAWISSREGRAYFSTLHKHFVKLNRDGTFRVHGVEPGPYQLAFRIYEPPEGRSCLTSPLATQAVEVQVPEGNNSLDLGEIEIKVIRVMPGEPAPDFEALGAEGESFKLSDYRGRFVLLDFWATWCGPCVNALPEIKAIHKDFAKPGEFTVISVSLDKDTEVAKRFAEERGLGWVQGYLGDWTQTDVPGKYGVSFLPGTFLIDREGMIVERNLRGTQLREAIEEALGRKKGE